MRRGSPSAVFAVVFASLALAAPPKGREAGPAGASDGPAASLARIDSLLAAGSPDLAVPLAYRAAERWADDPLYGWQVEGRVGAVLVATGLPEQALPHLERAAGQRPQDGGIRHQLGLASLALGRRGRALAEFEQAAELDPAAPAPRLEAGRLRGEFGDWQRARAVLEEAGRLCGGCPEADRLLGSLLLASGRPEEALPPLQRLWAAHPDSAVRQNLLAALAGAGRDTAVLRLVAATPAARRTRDDWRMAVQAEGRSGGARWSAAALAAADSGGVDLAGGSRFPRDDALFWAQASLNLLTDGQTEAALKASDRALALDGRSPAFHHNRAAILTRLGRFPEARAALDSARALEDTTPAKERP